jgi:CheY-like chemotaxis protein
MGWQKSDAALGFRSGLRRYLHFEGIGMPDKKQRILIVDDEPQLACILQIIFENTGYETTVAYSGEEAVEVASSFQPDCMVSDVMMGAMNGIEAAIAIMGTLPQCKVLFISGNAAYGDWLGNTRANEFDFEILSKPVPPPELLEKVSRLLSARVYSSEH